MKNTFTLILLVLVFALKAQTSTKNTTSISNCTVCSGTASWNLLSPMNPSISFGSMEFAKDLQSKSYSFAIPSGATILGIEVLIQYENIFTMPSKYISDTLASLLKGGVVVGSSKHALTPAYTATNITSVNFGGSTDLWGSTWTPADINANDFGFNLKLYSNWPNLQLKLWQGILITVHYSTTTGIIESQTSQLNSNEKVIIANKEIKLSGFDGFENPEFSVYDLTGKKITSINPKLNTTISLQEMYSGIYFYTITSKTVNRSKKFVLN